MRNPPLCSPQIGPVSGSFGQPNLASPVWNRLSSPDAQADSSIQQPAGLFQPAWILPSRPACATVPERGPL